MRIRYTTYDDLVLRRTYNIELYLNAYHDFIDYKDEKAQIICKNLKDYFSKKFKIPDVIVNSIYLADNLYVVVINAYNVREKLNITENYKLKDYVDIAIDDENIKFQIIADYINVSY